MSSVLPPCLMFDEAMPLENVRALAEIVALVKPKEACDFALLEKIKIAICSPISGFDSAWFERLPNLALISVFGVGLDKVDMIKARKRGVSVTITRDILTHDTADMAFALLFALTRRIITGDTMIRTGQWANGARLPHGYSLQGKKIGIVGLGAIGRNIARKAEVFGMQVSYYNRRIKDDAPWNFYDNLQELAENSDILAIALAATNETEKIISSNILEALGSQGILINIARGAVIDEKALISALADGRIAGAGLDVFCNEPDINQDFFALPNVVLAPHQGSATFETRLAMGHNVIDNIQAFLSTGYPLTPVS